MNEGAPSTASAPATARTTTSMHVLMWRAGTELLNLYGRALPGTGLDRQLDLTRTMRDIRDQRARVSIDDRQLIQVTYAEFRERVAWIEQHGV